MIRSRKFSIPRVGPMGCSLGGEKESKNLHCVLISCQTGYRKMFVSLSMLVYEAFPNNKREKKEGNCLKKLNPSLYETGRDKS